MMPRYNSDRTIRIVIGAVLLLAGVSALISGEVIGALVALAGFYLVRTTFTAGLAPSRAPATTSTQEHPRERTQQRRPQIYAHALQAVQAAGLNPDEIPVLPVDIGLLIFKEDGEPLLHRTKPIWDDVDYIQPFVQLRLPQRAIGDIRFEIIDSDGQLLFMREESHEFQRGRNLITPSARLPIHDAHAMDNHWRLRISADNVLLAEHTFSWTEARENSIRSHIREDGEITNELRALLSDQRLEPLSLDDLLDDQQQQRR